MASPNDKLIVTWFKDHEICNLCRVNGQGPLTSECFSRLKAAYSARNGAHKKAEEPYLCPFVSKKERNAQASANQGFSTAAAMCMHGTPHKQRQLAI